jgi:hypothetical protein
LSDANFKGCNILGNYVNADGGGMNNFSSSPKLLNCSILGNHANNTGRTGGFFSYSGGSTSKPVLLINCLIAKSTAGTAALEIGNQISVITLVNCTIAVNTNNDSAINNFGSGTVTNIQNTIVWGGRSTNINGNGGYNVKYSLMKGSSDTNNGNIDASGLSEADIFENYAIGNYALKPSSTCINVGNNSVYTDAGGNLTTDKDLAGNARLTENTIDLGAYEYSGYLSANSFQNLENTMSFYPNPAKNVLYFSEEILNAKILDLSGKLVMQIYNPAKSIDVSQLAKNVYLISIQTKKGTTINRKFIKE